MSSYHSKFTFLNKDSDKDFGWFIVHFDPDEGETSSYLSQEQIYTNSYNGSKRILYGTKWSEVAIIKITVVKQDGSNFTLSECRDAYRWLTGNPNASWLDLYSENSNEADYCFLCTVQDVKPQKLDASTVGMNIYFESVSPWAYSPKQVVGFSMDQSLVYYSNGVLSIEDSASNSLLRTNSSGVLYNSVEPQFKLLSGGIIEYDDAKPLVIYNKSDDLYSYVYMDVMLINRNGSEISIKNEKLNEETIITGLKENETVVLSSSQFIVSDKPGKMMGNNFNYVWPRLGPGENKFVIDGLNGTDYIEFTFRYPMKVGDSAMDVDWHGGRMYI